MAAVLDSGRWSRLVRAGVLRSVLPVEALIDTLEINTRLVSRSLGETASFPRLTTDEGMKRTPCLHIPPLAPLPLPRPDTPLLIPRCREGIPIGETVIPPRSKTTCVTVITWRGSKPTTIVVPSLLCLSFR